MGESRSYNLKTENTVIKALYEAMRKRKPKEKLIFHSDKGVQYHSKEFRNILKAFNITQSTSGKGNCYDNAVAESFFKTLKSELLSNGAFKTKREAKIKVFEYIELYYNKKRIHSSLNWCTPEEYLENYYRNTDKREEETQQVEQKEAV
ncbi:IS3 family transposase [Hippea sp. KM1]|uniref:IS3 family transposase n=1 Tax=Hippea sp. KM1 TaxID=944481 RepID=UPI0004B842A7|nr:IS3 family transposase [Hippea sp. KM1]